LDYSKEVVLGENKASLSKLESTYNSSLKKCLGLPITTSTAKTLEIL